MMTVLFAEWSPALYFWPQEPTPGNKLVFTFCRLGLQFPYLSSCYVVLQKYIYDHGLQMP